MKMTMDLGTRGYDIVHKRGALGRIHMLANLSHRKVLIVTSDGLPEQYVKDLKAQCPKGEVFGIGPGEEEDGVAVWQRLLAWMTGLEMGADDLLVGLGGTRVGRITGFAAATYLSGIPYLLLPTTTRSMADTSVGGRVGLATGGRADVISMIYQPLLVAADPDLLATLDRRHYNSGLAEALKAGLLGSRQLFELLEQDGREAGIDKVLYLAVRYKKGVVERDEAGRGERRLLGFGRTFGEGIARAGRDSGRALLHGECTALGMLPMIESRTLLRRTRAIMKKLELPLKCPFSADSVLGPVRDRQRRDGPLYTIARVKHAGHGYLEQVDYEELRLLYDAGSR